jgi:hypothetical protein
VTLQTGSSQAEAVVAVPQTKRLAGQQATVAPVAVVVVALRFARAAWAALGAGVVALG